MKYPYIGEADRVVLFTSEKSGVVLEGEGVIYRAGDFSDGWTEHMFKNITPEYLEGKCVKIESPEHSEFVQKLAFGAGLKWCDGDDRVTKVPNGEFINFTDRGMSFGIGEYEKITIPLPPKAEETLNENGFNLHFAGDKCDEWQVGGEVDTSFGAGEIVLGKDSQGSYIVEIKGCYYPLTIDAIKKPKTEAEILRDDLIALHCSTVSEMNNAIDLFIGKYNITKKPQ